MKKSVLICSSLIAALFVIYISFEGVTALVNKLMPPLDTYSVRKASVDNNLQKLKDNRFSPELWVSISKDDFVAIADESIQKSRAMDKIQQLDIEGLSDIFIKDYKLKLVEQGIEINIDATVTIDALELPVYAYLKGLLTVDPGINKIALRPSIHSLQLEAVNKFSDRIIRFKGVDEPVISSISSVLDLFIDNINGMFLSDPIPVRLDLDFFEPIKWSELENVPPNITVSGDSLDLNPQRVDMAFIMTPKNLNVIASTVSKGSENAPLEAQSGITVEDFSQRYNELISQAELTLKDKFGLTKQLRSSTTIAAIEKRAVSGLINRNLAHLDLKIAAKHILDVKDGFEEKVRIADRLELPNCSGLRRPFEGDSCDYSCSYSSMCDGYDCGWRHPDECIAEAACKAERETRRINCQRRKAQCKVDRESERVINDTENEIRVAKCKTIREAIRIGDQALEVVEVKGHYKIENSQIVANLRSLAVSDALTKATIHGAIQVSVDSNLDVDVNPEGLGHIACVFNFNQELDTHAEYNNPSQLVVGDMSFVNSANKLKLVITTRELELQDIELSPAPYKQLVTDPKFALNCSFLTMAMPVLAGADLLNKELITKGDPNNELQTMFGRANYTVESEELSISIKPIELGMDRSLSPSVGEKAIYFTL
ncbi:hypothetical protein [Photobacterium sanguinicancri]|uniref:hypothetical protein n=1 Tax=Photobacterium sanguinicancri TaxID=875932 RepID=UPI0021C3A8A6|nr:hypothetical protein [Photobacterium sanguinicancri]